MLGLLLNDLHVTYHISEHALCDGLCSPAMLKKYMLGKKKPEKLLGDALWQRAGKSMEKFEVFLEQDEFALAAERAHIQLLIRRGQLNEAENAIQNYKTLLGTGNPLHLQFLCLQYAEIYRRRQAPYQKQLKNLRDGIKKTIPVHMISPKILETRLLGMLELLLLERYAFLLEKEKQEEAARWYQALLCYLTRTESDGTPRDLADSYRLLPPVYYHQAKLLMASGEEEAALKALNEGIRILGERQGFEGLFIRMVELRIQLRKKLEADFSNEAETISLEKTDKEFLKNTKADLLDNAGIDSLKNANSADPKNTELLPLNSEIGCLRVLRQEIEEYGAPNLENIYPDYPERAIFCVNQIFRERRLARGVSEEDMADLIGCDVRTLRDAESGKRMPQTATKNKFFREFGLSTWKYCGSISTRTYSFFRESADMGNHNYKGNHTKANEIYKQITKNLNKDDLINQKFVKYWNICLQESTKKISKEKYRKTLLEILHETLPKFSSLNSQCILSEYEREALITLAWDINTNDIDNIEDILRAQYQIFCTDEVLSYFFAEYYMSLAYCLGRLARLRHNFKEAEDILENALKQIHFLQDDFRLDCLCIQRFGLETEKAQGLSLAQKSSYQYHWIRYAYAISKLYRSDNIITKYIELQLDEFYNDYRGILQDLT